MIVILACSSTHFATAQTVESLVMPGAVIRGHADIETECAACHKRFDRSGQRDLCLDCHENVALDVSAGAGFHGKSTDVGDAACSLCHTDHEGRNADILALDEAAFDHRMTDFELLGKHLEAECSGCHAAEQKRRDAPGQCVDCHGEDDVHKGHLGNKCADCHTPNDWLEFEFDHDTTDFSLVGKHSEVACLDCHTDATHQDTPTACFGCHAEDDAHEGRSGEQCETCHNPSSWTDASFDHDRNTDFPLEGRHAELTCNDCHSEDPFDDVMDMACVSCHSEDDEHNGHNGPDCQNCHSNAAWTDRLFDHNVSSDFPLQGSHETVACGDCHVAPIFETAPATGCTGCHADDEPHDGKLGDQCGECHNETKWEDAPLFDHDLTRFPLLGEHGNIECDACHETQAYTDTASSCVDCHREDDSHNRVFAADCRSCHNPVAWDLWLFDHNVQTDFALTGAHVDVACEACHRSPLETMQTSDGSCRNCHLSDDVHDGEFGSDCARCHTAESFTEVRSLP